MTLASKSRAFVFIATWGCGSGSTAATPAIVDAGNSGDGAETDVSPDTRELDALGSNGDGGDIGAPCAGDSDCAAGETCIMSPFYKGGYCTQTGCSPATNDGCPPQAVCRGRGAVMTTICFVRCSVSAPCRTGYTCCGGPPDSGDGFCAPDNSMACQ